MIIQNIIIFMIVIIICIFIVKRLINNRCNYCHCKKKLNYKNKCSLKFIKK
jgi:hypothetical protein